MTLLCDWCQYGLGFYTKLGLCGKWHKRFKGRCEYCRDFEPKTDILREINTKKKWQEFVRFYGTPDLRIVKKMQRRLEGLG